MPKGNGGCWRQIVEDQKCLNGTVAIGERKCSQSLTASKEQKMLKELEFSKSKIAQRMQLIELVITWQGTLSEWRWSSSKEMSSSKESSLESHQQ